MPWLYINDKESKTIRFYPSIEIAYFDLFSQQQWSIEITNVKLKLLNGNQLEKFLIELQSGLETGLKLRDVLIYISQHSNKSNIALVARAMKDEINMGTPFNLCFKRLVEPSLHGYCDLFIQNSTAEQLLTNLTILQDQISQLRGWLKRLQKSLIYPYFVIQFSLIIWLTSHFMSATQSLDIQLAFISYTCLSLIQLLILYLLQSSLMIRLTENHFKAFRLNKLFNLLSASLKTGNHLQNALTLLPKNFVHKQIKNELLLAYYHLRLGESYLVSFPTYWFPKESLLALEASCHSGDILRAIESAAHIHRKKWLSGLAIMEKICPVIGLLIAGFFVSKTLTTIYLPLINIR